MATSGVAAPIHRAGVGGGGPGQAGAEQREMGEPERRLLVLLPFPLCKSLCFLA